jgi:hypothetical protein
MAPVFVSDNFNRPDGTLGSNWTPILPVHYGSDPVLSIRNHGYTNSTPSTNEAGEFIWNADAFPNDQYAQATFTAVGAPGTDSIPGVIARGSVASNGNCYFALVGRNSYLGNTWCNELWERVNGVELFLAGGAGVGPDIHLGDTFGIEVRGTLIRLRRNNSVVFAVLNSDIASGSGGIGFNTGDPATSTPDNNTIASDFIAGSIPVLAFNEQDTFIRTNADIGPNWKEVVGAMAINSNVAIGSTASVYNRAYWIDTWPANQFSQAVYEGPSPARQAISVWVRMGDSGNGYLLQGNDDISGTHYQITLVTGGSTFTALLATSTVPVSGDVFRLEIVGTTLTAKVNGGVIGTITNTSIASGSAGIGAYGNTNLNQLGGTWVGGPLYPPPTPVSTDTASGAQETTFNITITGTDFAAGGPSTLSFSGTGITVNSYGTRNATTLVANITIAYNAALTARNIVITNADTQTGTLASAFTITAGAPNPISISQATGEQGYTLSAFTVTGTNFDAGGTSILSFSGAGVTVNSYGTRNATTLVANITIAYNAALTARDVIITNADTQTGALAASFTIMSGAPVPSGAVSPTSGVQGATITTFTVNGTNFATPTLSFSGTGITVNSYSVQSSTQVVANITISGVAATTARDVIITNANAQTGTLAAAFTVTSSSPSTTPPITGTFRSGGGVATLIDSGRTSIFGTNLGTNIFG